MPEGVYVVLRNIVHTLKQQQHESDTNKDEVDLQVLKTQVIFMRLGKESDWLRLIFEHKHE